MRRPPYSIGRKQLEQFQKTMNGTDRTAPPYLLLIK